MALSVNGTAKAGRKVADDRWARARNDMVEKQIITKGIRDSRVVEAMRRVPHHRRCPRRCAGAYARGSADHDRRLYAALPGQAGEHPAANVFSPPASSPMIRVGSVSPGNSIWGPV